MARMRRIMVGALNITMHPHAPERYAELFQDLHAAGYIVKVRGADCGMIGTVQHVEADRDVLYGSLWRFLNLDPNEPWLDTKTRRAIDPENGAPIIPENLKPHLRKIEYVFATNGHRLFFDTKKMSPSIVKTLIERLCDVEAIKKKYGEIAVTIESEQESLETIMELERRAMIDIFLHRPNADDLSAEKKRALKRLTDQNAATVNEVLKAPRGGDLKPDKETRALMNLAMSNGHIKSVGYTKDDERVEMNTADHPLKESVQYDPDTETLFEILIDTARNLMKRLRKRG